MNDDSKKIEILRMGDAQEELPLKEVVERSNGYLAGEYPRLSENELNDIFKETFGILLSRENFEKIGPRKWVRSTKQPIRELFTITSLHNPCWGFSLDFVPHVYKSTICWHRTVKSADYDLGYDPLDFTGYVPEWVVYNFDGPNAFEITQRLANRSVPMALSWFASINSLEDFVKAFEAARDRKDIVRFGVRAQWCLAYAFTLAKMGRLSEAESELTRYCERWLNKDWLKIEQSVKQELWKLLRETAEDGKI